MSTMRTGHCKFLSHLHRLEISDSDECPCATRPQTPYHILQSCPIFDARHAPFHLVLARSSMDRPRNCGRLRTCPSYLSVNLAWPGTQNEETMEVSPTQPPSKISIYARAHTHTDTHTLILLVLVVGTHTHARKDLMYPVNFCSC